MQDTPPLPSPAVAAPPVASPPPAAPPPRPAAAPTPSPSPSPASDGADWTALPPEAATLAMIGGLFAGLAIGFGAAAFVGIPLLKLQGDLHWWQLLGWLAGGWLLFGLAGAWLAYRRWQSSAWKLDPTGLHLRRGRAWRREILVPRSRVQHLDIERGPIERQFGLATLILHTAGTRQHAIRQAGLPDAVAVALRDALVPASDRHDDVL
jgi:membrane protein YdbS with pleckstrin-like domain